jgi:RNA polymerase sigma-70 factor (ECF subfamily)
MILSVASASSAADFERLMLPHLEAAFRLAHAVTRDRAAAQDVVQDSYLKAFQAWGRYRDGNARAWLLTIVRRQAYDWLRRERAHDLIDIEEADVPGQAGTQESDLIRDQTAGRLRAAVMALPLAFRETVILKDIEDMPYKTIADMLGVPIGTVMSRLARGRELLRQSLGELRP